MNISGMIDELLLIIVTVFKVFYVGTGLFHTNGFRQIIFEAVKFTLNERVDENDLAHSCIFTSV